MRALKRWIGPTTALLLVLSAVPAGAVSSEGKWRGETSQDFKLVFIVGDDDRIKTVEAKVEYENDVCVRAVTWSFGLDVRVRDDGTFRLSLAEDNDDRDTLLIRGEFLTRRRAEGTFRGTFSDGGACNDLRAKGTWVAKRA